MYHDDDLVIYTPFNIILYLDDISCTVDSHYIDFAYLKESGPYFDTPKEQFLPFSTIFSIYLWLKKSNYIFICEMWFFDLFFPLFCKSNMWRYGYLEVFQRVPWPSR